MGRLGIGIALTLVGALALIGAATALGAGTRLKTLVYGGAGLALVVVGVATLTGVGPNGLGGGPLF